jgi:hypothetical protein
MRQLWFVGDADELLDEVVGSGQRTETNFLISQDLKKMSRKAALNSVG